MKRNSIPEYRMSISALQDRWADWQGETWASWQDQKADLDDCGIDRDEKTIKAWRKGSLPHGDAWAFLLKFGWPLLIALLGDSLAESYRLQEEDYARRQAENREMGRALYGLMGRDSNGDGGIDGLD